MAVYQMIFEIVLYLTEGLIIFYYARSLFEQKYSNIVSLLLIFAAYLALYFIYKLDRAYLNVIAILIFNILIFIFLYQCDFKTAIFHSVLLVVIMGACEWIVIYIVSGLLERDFNAYQNNYNIHVINVIVSKLVYYTLCAVLANLFSKKGKQNKINSVFCALLIMPMSSILVLLLFRYITFDVKLSNKMNIACSITFAFLLLTNIVVFFIYEYSISNAEKLYEFQAIKQKQDIEQQYLEIIEQNNNDLKIFTHDIKNHLEQISNLTDDEEIHRYISNLYSTVNQYSNIVLSGNKTLDIIISKYNTLCLNKNIKIIFNVKTSNLSDINNTDLSTILNNLLDNAVEAAQNSKNKIIAVNIFTKAAFEGIRIQNSCDTAPNASKTQLLTSKKDKSVHGLGIKSVKRTLKKYDGIFDWSYDEKNRIFETTILIPKN